MSSDRSCNGEKTREEALLHSYFTFLANFSQDRAREVVEKEKEICRCGPNNPWGQLLGSLMQLAGAEKQYLALSFLQPRSSVFLRKDHIPEHSA